MDGMLSQEEINALLGSMEADAGSEETSTESAQSSVTVPDSEMLTPEEIDGLGEIANISMGTAATTLSILVNNRVDITTPTVDYTTMEEVSEKKGAPVVFINNAYRAGLKGNKDVIVKEQDVKIIKD